MADSELLTTQTAFNSTTMTGAVDGVSINNRRRQYNFGGRIAELAPAESPFYVYLSKVAKKPTNDPIFKFMEQRHQWQRRYGIVVGYANVSGTWTVYVVSPYDKYGREKYTKGAAMTPTANTVATDNFDRNPLYFLPNQMVTMRATDGTMCNFIIDAVSSGTVANAPVGAGFHNAQGVTVLQLKAQAVGVDTYLNKEFAIPTSSNMAAQTYIQIIGSAFSEGTGAPQSWHDELWDREGYCQIFKTAIELTSGTSQSTEYRGKPNEYLRQWTEKLKEHKADMEQAFLFQNGMVDSAGKRYTWGILPYVEQYGKVYDFNYAGSNYDSFLAAMEDFFAPESGNGGRKLVLASRKIINWFNRLGKGSYVNNTAGSDAYNFDIQNVKGKFGHKITEVSTIFGDLALVQEPFLRSGYEDYCVAVDMANVAIRPLSGNGKSRDTFIKTNIQDNDVDGRQDLITTETGLEISLPETHAVFKFS